MSPWPFPERPEKNLPFLLIGKCQNVALGISMSVIKTFVWQILDGRCLRKMNGCTVISNNNATKEANDTFTNDFSRKFFPRRDY